MEGSCCLEWLVYQWMWCFLSVFYLSTLCSINLWSCLLSSVFAWGQARSKLGGLIRPFASLFYIIIYCYSSIYFIFRSVTYVILPILHVWWIMENWTPESGFCWKKRRRDALFLKINKSKWTYRSSYFTRWRRWPKGEAEMGQEGPSPPGGAVAPWAAPPRGLATLAHHRRSPFAYLTLSEP